MGIRLPWGRIRRLEGAAGRRRLVLPFGLKVIDRHLPEGGLALGALHEVAGGGHGAIDGAAAALFAAGIAARTRGKDLFAPALAQAGLMPDRVIYVEAGDEKSVLICFEEGLRHGGLGAVVAEVARLSTTASVTRWRISALPRNPLPVPGVGRPRWQLELIRCRAGESADFEVEACDAKGRLALSSNLAHGPAEKERCSAGSCTSSVGREAA